MYSDLYIWLVYKTVYLSSFNLNFSWIWEHNLSLYIVKDTKYLKLSKSVICMVLEVNTYYNYNDSPKNKNRHHNVLHFFFFFFNWGVYMSICEIYWSWGGSVNNNSYFGLFRLVELNHVQLFENFKFQSFSILLMMFVFLIIYTVHDIINICF